MTGERRIAMPALRQYELPDTPATALSIPPERDTFVVPDERPTPAELQSLPGAVVLPPLRPDEIPASAVRVLAAEPDRLLDDPERGAAKRTPDITAGRGRLLHPWDD